MYNTCTCTCTHAYNMYSIRWIASDVLILVYVPYVYHTVHVHVHVHVLVHVCTCAQRVHVHVHNEYSNQYTSIYCIYMYLVSITVSHKL